MSSYSKSSVEASSSLKHCIPNQKAQQQQPQKGKERNTQPVNSAGPVIETCSSSKQQERTTIKNNGNHLNNSKAGSKSLVSGKQPSAPQGKIISSPSNKQPVSKNTEIIVAGYKESTSTVNLPDTLSSSVASNDSSSPVGDLNKSKSTSTKYTNGSSTSGTKFHPGKNNNTKWRRNNFPFFYGGYPCGQPRRINVPSTIPYFGGGYPTDANFYFPSSGICPPHYSPIHHPHLRHPHLSQHPFLPVPPVAQTHPYHKYLALNNIGSLRRSKSAHGSFRSKLASPSHQKLNTR